MTPMASVGDSMTADGVRTSRRAPERGSEAPAIHHHEG